MRQKMVIFAGGLLLLIAFGTTVSGDFFAHYGYEVQKVNPAATIYADVPSEHYSLIVQPDAGIAPVLSRIERAQKSIDLVMYKMSDTQVVEALGAAVARGVSVRVLLNGGYYSKKEKANDAAYAELQKLNVPVKWSPTNFALTHQKTFIFDAREALVMTFNLQPRYYKTGRDFAVSVTNPNDVAEIQRVFEADFAGSYVVPRQSDTLLWSPGSEDETIYLIDSAHSTLDIYNELMGDQDIIAALVAAAQRGVHVRVNMTYATNWKQAYFTLRDAGVLVRTFPSSSKIIYIHAKMIIADGKTAFVGSENFSETSLNKNRELGLVLSVPHIVEGLQTTFDTDWAKSRPFTATK